MAEYETNALRTAALSNQKSIYVGAAAPTTPYDGQEWHCTSSDPPLVLVYDATNTMWMEHHARYYEEVVSGQTPSITPALNGDGCTVYDTEQSSASYYAYANGSWRNMGGALVRVYPNIDVVEGTTKAKGVTAFNWGTEGARVTDGQRLTLISTNITSNNSGDYALMFIGGTMAETLNGSIEGYIGSTVVIRQGLTTTGTSYSLCSGVVISDTSTNISVKHLATVSGDQLLETGLSMVTVIVKAE